MAIWQDNAGILIHTSPVFRLSGKIDFSSGTYNLTFAKTTTGRFNFKLLAEIWNGQPFNGGHPVARVFTHAVGNSHVQSGNGTWSEQCNGSLLYGDNPNYYFVTICEAVTDWETTWNHLSCIGSSAAGSVSVAKSVGDLSRFAFDGNNYDFSLGSQNQKVTFTYIPIPISEPYVPPPDIPPVTPPSFDGAAFLITGTTITFTPIFGGENVENLTWTATLGKNKVTGSNGDSAQFSLLANAVTYTIVFKASYDNPDYDEENEELYNLEDMNLNTEVYYDAKTYGVKLQQRTVSTTYFEANIFQYVACAGETNKLLTDFPPYSYNFYCTRRDGNIDSGEYTGNCSLFSSANTSVLNCIRVTGLEPNTSYRLYIWLYPNCKDFHNDDDAVGYIDFTTKPIIVPGTFTARVSGTSVEITPVISRWNGSSELYYTAFVYNDSGYEVANSNSDSKVCNLSVLPKTIISGLENGTKYKISFSAFTVDNCADPTGNIISQQIIGVDINDIEIVTYGVKFIDVGNIIPYTKYLENVTIQYTDGEKASAVSQDPTRGSFVKWWIRKYNSNESYSVMYSDAYNNIIDGKEIINCRRTNPNTFNTNKGKLLPNTDYLLYIEVDNVMHLDENYNDTRKFIRFKTKYPAREYRIETTTTGETLSITPKWIAGSSPDNELHCQFVVIEHESGIVVARAETTEKDKPIWFTKLHRGTYYDITYTAYDNEGNSTSDYITYHPSYGNGYGVLQVLTYKLTITQILYSTRAVLFTCVSNKALPSGEAIQYYIDQGPDDVKVDWIDTMNSGDSRSFIFLKHETKTNIRVRISNMKDQDGNFDTVEEGSIVTAKLTAGLVGFVPHVDHAIVTAQAYADGQIYNSCGISGTSISFVNSLCSITPVRENKGSVGNNFGSYPYRTFTGLTGGREYTFHIGLTDGVNQAEFEFNAYTLVELIRIYDATLHKYRLALPYLFHSGEFYPAPLYLYGTANGQTKWWHTDPERD